jgi:hypothetical protein
MLCRSEAVVILMYLGGSFMLKTAPSKRKKKKRSDVIKCSNGGRNYEDKGMKGIQEGREAKDEDTIAYLFKARIVEPEKQPLLGNGSVTRNSGVIIQSGVFCAVRPEAM